jgi:hypothetical protein
MFPFDAAGLLAILSAVDGRDPVIRQLHELLRPRSAELPPQVPSRRSPSADRTPARSAPCRNLQSTTTRKYPGQRIARCPGLRGVSQVGKWYRHWRTAGNPWDRFKEPLLLTEFKPPQQLVTELPAPRASDFMPEPLAGLGALAPGRKRAYAEAMTRGEAAVGLRGGHGLPLPAERQVRLSPASFC